MARTTGMGIKMLGEEGFKKDRAHAAAAHHGMGSRMQDAPAPEPAPKAAPTVEETGSYSVKELAALLAEAPARTHDLFDAELARVDGPRKTALRVLLLAEEQKQEPDEHLVAGIAATIEKL